MPHGKFKTVLTLSCGIGNEIWIRNVSQTNKSSKKNIVFKFKKSNEIVLWFVKNQ